MKKIPEQNNWTEQQMEECCKVFICYSELIVISVQVEGSALKSKLTILQNPINLAA